MTYAIVFLDNYMLLEYFVASDTVRDLVEISARCLVLYMVTLQ